MTERLRVFSQEAEPHLQAAAWQRAAERFFGVALELVTLDIDKHMANAIIDGATRAVVGRAREEADLRDALEAENRTGFTGLYDLAERRCLTVWMIDREGPTDRTALLIAAIFASVCLGPILGDDALMGVRSAREKLEWFTRGHEYR